MRPDDQETVLYYRLRSAISDGNEDGVRQILKLRTMRSAGVWRRLCPHVAWDRLGSIHPEAGRLWFDILGSDLEDCLEDSVVSLACHLGHESMVDMIVDAVLSIASRAPCARCKLTPSSMFEKEGPNGHAPLQVCAQKGLLRTAKKLLDAGCNVNHKGVGVNRTAMHYAVQNGHVDLALVLLEAGADPNDHTAARRDTGALVDITPPPRVEVPSPYFYAVESNHDTLVDFMLSKGLVSADSFRLPGVRTSPLSVALHQTSFEDLPRRTSVVKLLLQHGARAKSEDLRTATRWPTVDALKLLLDHGTDPNLPLPDPGFSGRRLLHVLCADSLVPQRLEKIKLVIQAGGDLGAKDVYGTTPFHLACSSYSRSIILYLASLPAIRVNAVNKWGVSPLMCLLSSSRIPPDLDTEDIVSLLEAVPFDCLHKDNHGRNMFSYAATTQQAVDMLNYLVRKGVNPSTSDSTGNYPFVYALCSGHLKVAAGLACLTKDLRPDWTIPHPSSMIFRHQQLATNWMQMGGRRPERSYVETTGEPLLHLGLVHGLLSLQNPSYVPRSSSRLLPVESIKGYEVSLFLKAVLSKNYDVNIRNSRGETALCLLMKQRHWHEHLKVSVVVLLLLEHGADPNVAPYPASSLPASTVDGGRRPDLRFEIPSIDPFIGNPLFNPPHINLVLPPPNAANAAAPPQPPPPPPPPPPPALGANAQDLDGIAAAALAAAAAAWADIEDGPLPDELPEPRTPLDHALELRNIHAATYLYLAGARVSYPRHSPLLTVLKRRHQRIEREALLVANADAEGEQQQQQHPGADQNIPPSLRRRTLGRAESIWPCSFFTKPHRCIVCLTQRYPPSLTILARRSLRNGLGDQLQHLHVGTQLGMPEHLFQFLKMVDFE